MNLTEAKEVFSKWKLCKEKCNTCEAIQFFLALAERVDEGKIDKILRENGVKEEQFKLIYRQDGSVLQTEGSFIRYLAQAIVAYLRGEK